MAENSAALKHRKRPDMKSGIRKGANVPYSNIVSTKSPSINNLDKEIGHLGSIKMGTVKRIKP